MLVSKGCMGGVLVRKAALSVELPRPVWAVWAGTGGPVPVHEAMQTRPHLSSEISSRRARTSSLFWLRSRSVLASSSFFRSAVCAPGQHVTGGILIGSSDR